VLASTLADGRVQVTVFYDNDDNDYWRVKEIKQPRPQPQQQAMGQPGAQPMQQPQMQVMNVQVPRHGALTVHASPRHAGSVLTDDRCGRQTCTL
jgi:hypothetical protein